MDVIVVAGLDIPVRLRLCQVQGGGHDEE